VFSFIGQNEEKVMHHATRYQNALIKNPLWLNETFRDRREEIKSTYHPSGQEDERLRDLGEYIYIYIHTHTLR
jgi:hypothetical protein